MNWDVQRDVLTEYWWSYRWISIGKPSLPNCVVLLRNDIVTLSGEWSLLYEWFLDSKLFNTMGHWIETFNMVGWLNIDEVIGESSVLGNHHYEIVWFCYEMRNGGRSCEERRLAVTASVTPFLSFSIGTKDPTCFVPFGTRTLSLPFSENLQSSSVDQTDVAVKQLLLQMRQHHHAQI